MISWPTQCTATHTAQKHHLETAAEAKDFIVMVKQKLVGRYRDADTGPLFVSFQEAT